MIPFHPLTPQQSASVPNNDTFNWNATAFFEGLTKRNKFAHSKKFTFCRVSGLDEALAKMLTKTAFVCVSDISQGFTDINNTPHTRRVKTVFLAMRHAIDNMEARQSCMDMMRELFRQFMSVLILEQTKLQEHSIYIDPRISDPRISFQEIDRYFFSGCACAYFQIAVDTYTDLQFNEAEWTE